MSRDLRFRVYISDQEKFTYFKLGKFDYPDRYLDQHKYPVQQYTGLKDKNGVEIYEGDIIKLFNDLDEFYEVVFNCFDNDILGFILEAAGGRGDWFSSRDREVVGNIFENKDLLT